MAPNTGERHARCRHPDVLVNLFFNGLLRGLGDFAQARFVWDKLHDAMEEALDNPEYALPLDAFHGFLRSQLG